MQTSHPPIGEVYAPGNIPDELKALPRWSPWRVQWNDKRGKWDKIPAGGRSTARPETWLTFDAAEAQFLADPGNLSGIGFVITGLTGYTFIDIDGCIDASGSCSAMAMDIINSVGSYTETSPSGRGLRIVARGAAPADWTNHDLGVEVYAGHAARFVTITGNVNGRVPVGAITAVCMPLSAARNAASPATTVLPLPTSP